MEEKTITIDGEHFDLEDPYVVIATQNPNQFVGTFELPESQLDRFFMGVFINFPSRSFEKDIIKNGDIRKKLHNIESIFTKEDVVKMQCDVKDVVVNDQILDYALDIIEEGRRDHATGLSFSVRTSMDLIKGAKGHAFLKNRNYVTPDDIKAVAPYVLGHRIGGNKGLKSGIILVEDILNRIQVR